MIEKPPLIALVCCFIIFGLTFCSSSRADNIEEPCWFKDKDKIQFSDVDLIVRTINTHLPAPDYPVRLLGIASRFKKDWPSQVGIIGMQEVEGRMADCKTSRDVVNGSECLASTLSKTFDIKVNSAYSNKVGTVVGDSWEITGSDYWNVGNLFERRYLLETKLKHSVKGWKLRFYNVHLSSGKKHMKNRLIQVTQLIRIVRNRAKPNELPPIVVGDFNAKRVFDGSIPEASVMEMEKVFYRPIDKAATKCNANVPAETGIDIVYIGRKNTFKKSMGEFVPIRTHNIRFDNIATKVDGAPGFFAELTNHDSQGISFRIGDTKNTQQKDILFSRPSNIPISHRE